MTLTAPPQQDPRIKLWITDPSSGKTYVAVEANGVSGVVDALEFDPAVHRIRAGGSVAEQALVGRKVIEVQAEG